MNLLDNVLKCRYSVHLNVYTILLYLPIELSDIPMIKLKKEGKMNWSVTKQS